MALVGWAVLIPTGLAMMDLRENSPQLLLGIMVLVWVADSAAYFTDASLVKTSWHPTSVRQDLGGRDGRAGWSGCLRADSLEPQRIQLYDIAGIAGSLLVLGRVGSDR